jgi:hypothetical protein
MVKKTNSKNKKLSHERKLLEQKAAKKKIQELRPFMKKLREIDLRKPISSRKIKQINEIFTEYQELTTRPVKIFRSNNKEHLKMAQAYARHADSGPKFDVAFIPIIDPKAKVRFKGDTMQIKMGNVIESVLFFDLVAMATNSRREIEQTIERHPNSQQFVIMAGKYLFNGGIKRSLIVEKVQNLMAQYANPDENNFWGNWLFGLVSAQYTNQKDYDEYRYEYRKAASRIKKNKAKLRREWLKKYGHKAYATGKERD